MKWLSKAIMAIGTIIALLAVCCLDSAGIYGYLAMLVAIAGGFIIGAGNGLLILAERRKEYKLNLKVLDKPDVVWIDELVLDKEK